MILGYAESNAEGEVTEVCRTYGKYVLAGAIKFHQIDEGELLVYIELVS